MRDEDPRLSELRDLGASVGRGIYLGPEVYFEKDFAPLLELQDGVVLSHGVTVLLHDSSLNNLTGAAIRFGEVVIERNAYVGAHSTLMCGVVVGAGALVGANSLVNSDVAPGAVAYGVPARTQGTVQELVARQRESDNDRQFLIDAAAWRDRDGEADAALLRALETQIVRRKAR